MIDGHPPTRTPDPTNVGMVVWLASELMFFAGLFAAWFTLRANATVWPPEGVELDTARTAVSTAVLLASSVTMHLAVHGRPAGRPGRVGPLAAGHRRHGGGLPRQPGAGVRRGSTSRSTRTPTARSST